jgi:hypothetical protein
VIIVAWSRSLRLDHRLHPVCCPTHCPFKSHVDMASPRQTSKSPRTVP